MQELTVLPKPFNWWGGGWLPPPQEHHPSSWPSRPWSSALGIAFILWAVSHTFSFLDIGRYGPLWILSHYCCRFPLNIGLITIAYFVHLHTVNTYLGIIAKSSAKGIAILFIFIIANSKYCYTCFLKCCCCCLVVHVSWQRVAVGLEAMNRDAKTGFVTIRIAG